MTTSNKLQQLEIVIRPDDSIFPDLSAYVILFACMGVAVNVHTHGAPPKGPGSFGTIHAGNLDGEIHVILDGILDTALRTSSLPSIGLRFAQKQPVNPSPLGWSSGFQKAIEHIGQSFFLNFYERWSDRVRNACKLKQLKSWPSAWQFAWVVRNALAHDGCIFFKDSKAPAISWRGLSFAPSNNGDRLLHARITTGDLLVLALEMQDELTDLGLSKVASRGIANPPM
jgi:hypothetical protein